MIKYMKIFALAFYIVTFSYGNKTENNRKGVMIKSVKFGECKGPKSRDCGGFSLKLSHSNGILRSEFSSKEDIPAMPFGIMYESHGQRFMKTLYPNICSQPFIKKIFEYIFPIKKGCIIPKGIHTGDIDMLSWPSTSVYLFDSIWVKSYMYNKTCNVFCKTFDIEFLKK